MCIIILSSRIYVRRHPNDEIFVLLLTNTGHFLILELCDYDYRGITADTAVLPPSPLPCSSLIRATRNPIRTKALFFAVRQLTRGEVMLGFLSGGPEAFRCSHVSGLILSSFISVYDGLDGLRQVNCIV